MSNNERIYKNRINQQNMHGFGDNDNKSILNQISLLFELIKSAKGSGRVGFSRHRWIPLTGASDAEL